MLGLTLLKWVCLGESYSGITVGFFRRLHGNRGPCRSVHDIGGTPGIDHSHGDSISVRSS